MIFAFVVSKFRFLARVPLLPHFFDVVLLAATALINPRLLALRETLENRARRSLRVRLSVHKFGGVGFTFGEYELAHLHGNGLFDAFLGARARDEVVQKGMAFPHHVFPKSGWVSFWIKAEQDVGTALELMRIAREYRTESRAREH